MACKLSSEEHVRPGHLDLQLNASSVHGQYQISHNIATMDKILRNFGCSDCDFKDKSSDSCHYLVTRNAILNLKGAFLYYQKQYIEACNQFEQILETDETNQNALCNLHHIYQKLGNWKRANKYYERYTRCSDDKKGEAAYLGEQGFAILFDCHTKTNELERYKRSVKMFEACLEILNNLCEGKGENGFVKDQKKSDWKLAKLQWKLWYAQSLHRMNNASRVDIDVEYCYRKGLATLKSIIEETEDSNHNHLASVAYTYVGCFLSKRKWNDLKKFSEELKLQKEFDDPNLAFVEALQIQRNTEALIRYALFLKFTDICKAIDCIKEALDIDGETDANWFVWSVSSDLHVFYVEKFNLNDSREVLTLAIEHGEKGASKNPTASLSVTLGKAYHYLARDYTYDKKEKRKLYLKSLENFLHALQHLDGDKQDYVHIAHGKCLLDMGQYRPALESFKRAVELGLDAKRNISFSFSSMMKCYMKVLEEESIETEKHRLLEIISYWLHIGLTKEDLVKKNISPRRGKTLMEVSDWQTIGPKALIELVKFLLMKKEDESEKLISWCISSKNLENFQHIVLDILLLIARSKSKTLINGCLKLLYDPSCLSPSERNRTKMEPGSQSLFHMNEYHRSWYVNKISNCLIEVQCKRCKDSKLWKEDCGHGINAVVLYCMIAAYCPSLALEISDHLMTHDARLAQMLLDAFQKKCISHVTYGTDEFIEQHVMTCISDLHYQACWLRANSILMQRILNQERFYRKEGHPQYQHALNRCLSLREDREDALHQLIRISTFDEDSHMKLMEWQNKRDYIYFNFCMVDSTPIHHNKLDIKKRKPKRRFPKYEYDFLVMNSDEDSDWVRFELLPTLEERYGFKGCFQERDYMPGITIFKEFENKVKESAKVLLVLTENFKNDDLCCFQMHSALMKKLLIGSGKVIPLVAGSGDFKTICQKVIPEELQHIVCFFLRISRFDWERLVKAIEDD